MQTVEVSENQAKDLRFGRKITISAISTKNAAKNATKNAIAYVKATKDEQNDVVAVLETAEKSQATASSSSTLFKSQEKIEKIEKNTNQIEAKPIVVFVQS